MDSPSKSPPTSFGLGASIAPNTPEALIKQPQKKFSLTEQVLRNRPSGTAPKKTLGKKTTPILHSAQGIKETIVPDIQPLIVPKESIRSSHWSGNSPNFPDSEKSPAVDFIRKQLTFDLFEKSKKLGHHFPFKKHLQEPGWLHLTDHQIEIRELAQTEKYLQLIKAEQNNILGSKQKDYYLDQINRPDFKATLSLQAPKEDFLWAIHKILRNPAIKNLGVKEINIRSSRYAQKHFLQDSVARFLPGTDVIYVRSDIETELLEKVLTHEMIHAAHYNKNKQLYTRLSMEKLKPEACLIALQVSQRAVQSPLEFVAETGVKLLKGEALSPEVMSMYKNLGGPHIEPHQTSRLIRANSSPVSFSLLC